MLNLPPLEALLAFHGLLTDPIIAALSKAAQSGKAAPSLSAQLVEKAETLGLWGRLPATYLVHLLGGASLPLSRFLEKRAADRTLSQKRPSSMTYRFSGPIFYLDPCDLSLSPLLAHYEPTIHHARKGETCPFSRPSYRPRTRTNGVNESFCPTTKVYGSGLFY